MKPEQKSSMWACFVYSYLSIFNYLLNYIVVMNVHDRKRQMWLIFSNLAEGFCGCEHMQLGAATFPS